MDYEKIKEINKSIKKTPIRGKEYVMVKDRVSAFREVCPSWGVITELIKMDNQSVTMKATVCDEEGNVKAVGHANEEWDSSTINRTSALENCETSAIGRALGLLGIGIDDSFASANEVSNAQRRQAELEAQDEEKIRKQAGERLNEKDYARLAAVCDQKGATMDVCQKYGIESLRDVTYSMYAEIMRYLSV